MVTSEEWSPKAVENLTKDLLTNSIGVIRSSEALKYISKRVVQAMRTHVLDAPYAISVECFDRPRTVTINPDGSISVEHSPKEVRAALAAEALGQPACPCIQLRRRLATASPLPWAHLGRAAEEFMSFIREVKQARSVRWYWDHSYPSVAPERRSAFDKISREVNWLKDSIPHPGVDISVSMLAYLQAPVRELKPMLRESDLDAVCTASRSMYFQHELRILLGLDFFRRWRGERWFCRHPDREAEFLIVHESACPGSYDGRAVRDCVILVPRRNPSHPMSLLKRVYVDESGVLVAWVAPFPGKRGKRLRFPARGSYPSPTLVRSVPPSWGAAGRSEET